MKEAQGETFFGRFAPTAATTSQSIEFLLFTTFPTIKYLVLNTTTIDASITHIRPRFKFRVSGAADDILRRIEELLANTPPQISGKIIGHHVILDVIGEAVHFWSPQLNFRVEQDEDAPEQVVIAGLIGPRPAVWTLFMFVYFSIGIAGFFATSYGISRYMVGESSLTIYGLPVAILMMLTAYLAGKFGERLGEDQVKMLQDFVRAAVEPNLEK